ncbi:MAG: type II secretion system F family protein, partial [Candidatus Babeliales bacterium]|nr:type II secretion system F family protein [Candidatus Babeliales bacterium]
MPYFDWSGIDWFGNISKGTQFARSQEELCDVLLTQEIGLIKATLKKHTSLINPIKLAVKVQFFKELAILLDSGILLPRALNIIEKQITHPNFKRIVKEIYLDVSQGISINDSIVYYNDVFDNLTIQIIKTGSESGNLAISLKLLSEHLERRQLFLTKLRSALILPLVTFILFVFVTGLIFVTVIPTFSSILLSSGQELSFITKTLFNISNLLKEHILLIFGSWIMFLVVLNKILKNQKFKSKLDPILIRLPIIGNIIIYN